MLRVIAAAVAILVAACTPQPAAEAPVAAEAAGCHATAERAWTGPAGDFLIEAHAFGKTCEGAAVALIVRAPEGQIAYSNIFAAEQLMPFAGVTDAQFAETLTTWIADDRRSDTSVLPVWEAGKDNPVSGEFDFYPGEGLDRDAYEQIRAGKLPLFCFVQGMESEMCLAIDGGGVTDVGVQTFPG